MRAHGSVVEPRAAGIEAGSGRSPREAGTTSADFAATVVSPRAEGWPWLSQVGPLRHADVASLAVDNLFRPCPSLTGVYRALQYRTLRRALDGREVAFLFSPDVAIGLTGGSRRADAPRRIYVGFTQDGHWSARRRAAIGRALRRCDAVTAFSEPERDLYIERYDLDPDRIRVVPIHDEPTPIAPEPGAELRSGPFVLALGAMNRTFAPIARICRAHHLPLVILTRRSAPRTDLDETRGLGAEVVLDAPLSRALAWMERATVLALPFRDPSLPAGFTTVMHAMRLGTPVVATECMGIREHVDHGKTGFVVPHDDLVALRQAIRYLWRDARPRRAMGETARRRWAARHAAEVAAPVFHRLALDVLAAPRVW